jgi:hypothetical protein
MNGNEVQRLAHSINAHRPDWMISSLTTFIGRHMAQWSYRDAAVALTFVACDATADGQPASATPKRVLEQGPWRVAAAIGGSSSIRTHAPKAHEECGKHPGSWAHNCGGCAVDRIASNADEPPSPLLPPVTDVSPRLADRLAKYTTKGDQR